MQRETDVLDDYCIIQVSRGRSPCEVVRYVVRIQVRVDRSTVRKGCAGYSDDGMCVRAKAKRHAKMMGVDADANRMQ